MKVSAAKRAEHRAAIIREASRTIREVGAERLTVADVMSAAGLTHGGFYGHFAAKDALIAEAVSHAMEETRAQLAASLSIGGLPEYAAGYLSLSHLEHPGEGCVMATMGSDIPRLAEEVSGKFKEGVQAFLDVLEAGAGLSRQSAIRELALMVGGMTLARAVAKDTASLANEILDACRTSEAD